MGGAAAAINVVVGGGMGMNHTKADTFPRLGDPLGFITPDQVVAVVETIVKVQRDYGNRSDRKHARMKYLIHNWGIDRFRAELEARLGYQLQPFAPMPPAGQRAALRLAASRATAAGSSASRSRTAAWPTWESAASRAGCAPSSQPSARRAAHAQPGHPADGHCAAEQRPPSTRCCATTASTPTEPLSNIQLFSMACVALPTCGLAVAESERALPGVIDELEQEVARWGWPRSASACA